MSDATDLELVEDERAKLAAETREAVAKAELHAAQARKVGAEALAVEAEAEMAMLKLTAERRKEATEMAKDEYHHVYQFGAAVDSTSVRVCMQRLAEWSRTDPGCDIEIVFNSPGGSVIDGFALWDYLSTLRASGHHLTTVCRGMAASMAGILLQAGDVRVMGSESVILVHEISFGAVGKIGEVEDEVAFAKMLTRRVLRIFAARTKLTERQIDVRWKRKDWWMTSDEALKLGFCDEVR